MANQNPKNEIFPCTSCGACCKRLGLISDEEKKNFPFDILSNGVCSKLVGNKCSVYNDRPDICNINKMHEIKYKTMGITKNELFRAEAEVCNRFIKEDGLDDQYLIDLKQFD